MASFDNLFITIDQMLVKRSLKISHAEPMTENSPKFSQFLISCAMLALRFLNPFSAAKPLIEAYPKSSIPLRHVMKGFLVLHYFANSQPKVYWTLTLHGFFIGH